MKQSPFPSIDRTEINTEKLRSLKSESDFVGLGVDIMIETASYITVALCIMDRSGSWSRDQAVIGGNMVRLYKLFSAMLDQTVQHRRETSFIIARLAFETIVTVKYLIKEYDNGIIDSYVKHSLDHEKKLNSKIQSNIDARAGIVMPIEERMQKSINRMLTVSEVSWNDIPNKKEKNWGGKNLYEKSEAVGLEKAYLAMFSGASQNVHGAWGDIYTHHLEYKGDGRFAPNIEWCNPRPQLLYAVSIISLDVAEEFANFMGGEETASHLTPHLDDLRERIGTLDEAHEAYLAGKVWPQL